MAYLKQHRKATLELEGRRIKGNFDVSLTNQGDRETIVEFIAEMRKQLRVFDPSKPVKAKVRNLELKKKRPPQRAAKKKKR